MKVPLPFSILLYDTELSKDLKGTLDFHSSWNETLPTPPVFASSIRPLSPWILQARILEWVAMSSSTGSSQPKDQTCMSYIYCIGRWVLYHWLHLGRLQVLCSVVSKAIIDTLLPLLLFFMYINCKSKSHAGCPIYNYSLTHTYLSPFLAVTIFNPYHCLVYILIIYYLFPPL